MCAWVGTWDGGPCPWLPGPCQACLPPAAGGGGGGREVGGPGGEVNSTAQVREVGIVTIIFSIFARIFSTFPFSPFFTTFFSIFILESSPLRNHISERNKQRYTRSLCPRRKASRSRLRPCQQRAINFSIFANFFSIFHKNFLHFSRQFSPFSRQFSPFSRKFSPFSSLTCFRR